MKDELDLLDAKEPVQRDYWAIVVRRRWYLIAPLFICGLLGSVVAQLWPLLYQSEALILVEQQKIPEQYVTPNVILSLQNRLDSMTQQIMSRTRLQRLIEEFNLYSRERSRLTMDEVIDKMRKAITVQLVQTPGRQGDLTGFRIYYSAESPRTAQRITNELTSMFIDENLRARTQQSASTTQFLENQLEEARKDLEQQEQRLREYKLRFVGELPEQQQSNLQILSSLEAQFYSINAALERAEQQKVYLESMRTQYESMGRTLQQNPYRTEPGAGPNPVLTADAVLMDLRKQLSELKTRYTPEHPDIVRIAGLVAQWEGIRKDLIRDAEKADKGKSTTGPAATAEKTGPRELALVEADSRLKAVEIEIEGHKRDSADLRRRIQQVQQRLNLTPVREQQLSDITRTSENSRAHYQSLLQKKLQSELASNLEKRQQGEQFRILDPASLPTKPEGRLTILFGGWFLGVCLGVGLAVLREFTNRNVNDEKDLKLDTSLPIFSVPVIRLPREELQRKWRRSMEAAGAVLLLLASVGLSIRTYLMS